MSKISIIAYIVLTVSIGYAFIYPSLADMNALSAQKQKYEDSLEKVSNIEAKKNELLDQFNAISESDKENIETILPDSFDFVRLISQIDNVAAKYGIYITNASSKEINSGGTSIENAEAPKPYSSAVVALSFLASYERFNDFLADLEKSLRILDIRSINLESQEKGLYKFDVEFETYWYE